MTRESNPAVQKRTGGVVHQRPVVVRATFANRRGNGLRAGFLSRRQNANGIRRGGGLFQGGGGLALAPRVDNQHNRGNLRRARKGRQCADDRGNSTDRRKLLGLRASGARARSAGGDDCDDSGAAFHPCGFPRIVAHGDFFSQSCGVPDCGVADGGRGKRGGASGRGWRKKHRGEKIRQKKTSNPPLAYTIPPVRTCSPRFAFHAAGRCGFGHAR